MVSLIATGLIFATGACAQEAFFLIGHIQDPSSAGVSGAAISVVNEDSGFRHTTQSQSDGAYAVGSLAPGLYKITVRKEGFRTMIRFHVPVGPPESARADFALMLGSVLETITVEGAAAPFPRDGVSVETLLGQAEIEKLPVNGRGLGGLMELAPGTTIVPATRGDAGQFVTGGQRPNANYFTVDGISANNGVSAGGVPAQASGGALPVMSAFGSLDSLITLDAVDELRVQTSTTAADFGRLPGASIAVASRAGSAEFHGSAGYSFRHEDLSANDWFANRASESRSPLREHNIAATLGGPLVPARTFFFMSYEHMSLQQPFAWYQAVPTLAARAAAPAWSQPALALFPAPNGNYLGKGLAEWNGRSSRPALLDAGSIRVDHALTPRLTIFGRYSDSPSANEFGSIQVNHLDFRSWSATAGLNVRVSSALVMDFRANGSSSSAHSVWSGTAGCELQPLGLQFLNYVPSCDLLVRFWIGGVGELVSGREGDRSQKQTQLVDSNSWKLSSHWLRWGADYRSIAPERRDANDSLSLIADSLAAFDNSLSFWIARTKAEYDTTLVSELSLWVHDTWQVTRHLTFVGGLRWECTPAPTPAGGVNFLDAVSDSVDPAVRPLWLGPNGHFAPRFGVAYSPGSSGRTVVRAGAGLYYDSSLSIATDALNGGPMSVDFVSGRFAPFSGWLTFGFLPALTLPQVVQWSASVEHSLSPHDMVSIGYMGALGQDLIRREVGGAGSSPTRWVALTTNNGASNYEGLVVQYRRRLQRGLESLVSYSWSHSIDNGSSDAFLLWAGPGSGAARDHASSDFDLRQSLAASFSYSLPSMAKGWSIDGILRARSGFPITILQAEQSTGIPFMNAFRPDLVPNTPLWIIDGNAPGGRRLNPRAFHTLPAGTQGNLGRNAISGFGMSQLDLALRRQFRISDRSGLEFRLEAFNALNHANFADPVRYLSSPFFGQSTSMLNLMLGTGSAGSGLSPLLQNGGARSVEAVVKFRF
jgi:hypothetical protein